MAIVSPRRRPRRHRHVPAWVHVLLAVVEGLRLWILPLPLPVHLALLAAVHVAIAVAERL
jgi:hypothetical protein